MIGIVSFGAYIPRMRLSRQSIVDHIGWRTPGLSSIGKGERAMCNWDEDSLTMAVAAARDCLSGQDRALVTGHYLASTSLPFADRLGASITSTALNLRDDLVSADFTTCQRAGTSAVRAAIEAIKGGEHDRFLVTATDRRIAKPGSTQEMLFGDGAASLLVGSGDVIAEFVGGHSVSYDFVDHYRGQFHQYDYNWEERWVRDEGYSKIIPEAINGLLAKLNLNVGQVDKLIFPSPAKRDHLSLAKAIGVNPDSVVDNLFESCGETGTAHPLLMLVSALEKAKPGELIVVAGFGQGCDALAFRVTENILKLPRRNGVSRSLASAKATGNYLKFLVFRDILPTEAGIRAEAPNQTALTTLWRRRKMILGLVGGKCQKCGSPQYPRLSMCVNPECQEVDKFDDYELADRRGIVKSFTADNLAVAIDPPAIYGIVQFDGGGRFICDFTDCELSELNVGLPVRMSFRKRLADAQRGFTGYFWKAVPIRDN